ncbi:uncharacterized protein FIBRA_01185 [Fibroporia radiculosa]|uniref:Uncharacterized protein n=1 Tax=Fibroporia radiculosa TaxID=599839 RepID=J4GJI5_9APHY|nr:uncharacterized protein FIBRA_01185 [Fibroporia radiculosa]CCL99170.1 predicted protein [Fibroporia radiculosa]
MPHLFFVISLLCSPVAASTMRMLRKYLPPLEHEVTSSTDSASSLKDYLRDVWAALETFDPYASNADDKFRDLCLFIIRRSYGKLQSRIRLPQRIWKARLSDAILQWSPSTMDTVQPRWVEASSFLLDSPLKPPFDIFPIPSCGTTDTGLEWEFSSVTLKTWAWYLAALLRRLEVAVEHLSVARGKGDTAETAALERTLHAHCYDLCGYVLWKQGIVKRLLVNSSLGDTLEEYIRRKKAEAASADGERKTSGGDDESQEMRPFANENMGQLVFRHLKLVVASHAAAMHLFSRRSVDLLRGQLRTATESHIAVNKKCCWCCTRLAEILLKRYHMTCNVPGSHGLVFAWSPPVDGLELPVLLDSEGCLWDELFRAVQAHDNFVPTHSRHSSASSSVVDVEFKQTHDVVLDDV